MKHIDRLIIKAKKHVNLKAERLIQAFVYPNKDSWIADGRLWNGVKGSGITVASCRCKTKEEAIEAIHELADKHPNDKTINILVDDIDE